MTTEFSRSTEVFPARRVSGRIRVPGDKSISHRYAILGALADGETVLEGYAPGNDCASTLSCLQQLGVHVERPDGSTNVHLTGRGLRGLEAPAEPLDAGNSGSTLRMLAGVLAAHPFEATLTGDQSLRRRPMLRVARPLRMMGAEVSAVENRPPVTIRGGSLSPIDYRPDTASAQVKTAVLLAGLQTAGVTTVREIASTRDHTERALRAFGGHVEVQGLVVSIGGNQRLRGGRFRVPGDPSSAAFWASAAAGLPGSEIEILDVGLNPTRTAFFSVLARMGARVESAGAEGVGEEPMGVVRVRHDRLDRIVISPEEVPGLIDELPVLGALGCFGGGVRVTGAAELRTKESDRIAALVAGLRALGADAEELSDGFEVRPARPLAGGSVDACDDHRLAMAFAIAALGAREAVTIRGADAADVSYPGFFDVLASICAKQ
jgi:3-phosphoshikimate 1-carboxyvinyltransferase